jgi:hypothetical protein
MSANEQLQSDYQEWRRLAEAEGEAIRNQNWPVVTDCQTAKQHLQPLIARHADEARQEWLRLGLDCATQEKSFRAIVAELIAIERGNGTLLNDVRQASQAQFNQLEQATATLRQVQRSYAPLRPPAWTSFS